MRVTIVGGGILGTTHRGKSRAMAWNTVTGELRILDIPAGFAEAEAHAISGKLEHFDDLIALGAKQCISRKDLYWGQRPLETSRWAGAIDNVGGDMLSGLTRELRSALATDQAA